MVNGNDDIHKVYYLQSIILNHDAFISVQPCSATYRRARRVTSGVELPSWTVCINAIFINISSTRNN